MKYYFLCILTFVLLIVLPSKGQTFIKENDNEKWWTSDKYIFNYIVNDTIKLKLKKYVSYQSIKFYKKDKYKIIYDFKDYGDKRKYYESGIWKLVEKNGSKYLSLHKMKPHQNNIVNIIFNAKIIKESEEEVILLVTQNQVVNK